MNCYYCDQRRAGGTRFAVNAAVGVCRRCGVGVCREHSVKEAEAGAPLLCQDCAKQHAHLQAAVSDQLPRERAMTVAALQLTPLPAA